MPSNLSQVIEEVAEKAVSVCRGSVPQSTSTPTNAVPRSLLQGGSFTQAAKSVKTAKTVKTVKTVKSTTPLQVPQGQHTPAFMQVPPFKRPTPKIGAQTMFSSKSQSVASKRIPLPAGNDASRQMPMPMENFSGMNAPCDCNCIMPMMSNAQPMPAVGAPAGGTFGQAPMMRPRPMGMMQGFGAMGSQPNTPRMTGVPQSAGASNMPGVAMDGQSAPMNYPFPNSFPSGFPNGFSNGIPNGIPNGMPNGIPNGLPNGYPNGMMNGFPNGMMNGIPNGLPNGMPNGMPNGLPNGIPNGLPNGYPNGMMNGFPNGMMNGVPNGMMNGSPYYPQMQPMMGDGKMNGGNAGKIRMTPMQQPQQGMMQPYFGPGMSGEMDGNGMPGTQ